MESLPAGAPQPDHSRRGMRIARVSAPEGDKLVVWWQVVDVRFIGQGRRRFIALTYQDTSERHLQLHQARDLWYDIEEHSRCEAPCYYRHEAETAPKSCTCCLLAECLEGVGVEVRPDPIPPRRIGSRWRWTHAAILALSALVILLMIGLTDADRRAASLPYPTAEGPKSPIKGSRGAGKADLRRETHRERGEVKP